MRISLPLLLMTDMEAIARVFAWAFEGTDPYPPGPGPYECAPSN